MKTKEEIMEEGIEEVKQKKKYILSIIKNMRGGKKRIAFLAAITILATLCIFGYFRLVHNQSKSSGWQIVALDDSCIQNQECAFKLNIPDSAKAAKDSTATWVLEGDPKPKKKTKEPNAAIVKFVIDSPGEHKLTAMLDNSVKKEETELIFKVKESDKKLATLFFVGDILLPQAADEKSWWKKDYVNVDPHTHFEGTRKYIENADLAIGNFEMTISDKKGVMDSEEKLASM